MRIFTLFLFTIFFTHISAQHFEWAASASHFDLGYEFSSVDKDNNIVVGGNGAKRGNPKIYDGKGNEVNHQLSQFPTLILSYSSEGNLNWSLSISSALEGITHDENNRTVLLVRKNRSYSLLHLNDTGKIVGTILIPYKMQNPKSRSLEINFERFKITPDGGYLLAGWFLRKGKIFENLDAKTDIEGEKFLLKINKKGIPVWADVLPSGNIIPFPKVSVSPTGVIYVGGTFKSRKAPENYESYVISYSERGKKNWMKLAGKQSVLNSITSNSKGVCIGIQLKEKTNEVFDRQIDTSSNRFMSLITFDRKGNTKWVTSSSTDEAYSLQYDRDNNLYVLGGLGYLRNKHHIIGSDTIIKFGFSNYLACFYGQGTRNRQLHCCF